MNTKAEVSTTLTIRQLTSTGVTEANALLYAKQRADREFDHYFPKIYPYITKIETVIVREEKYLPKGCMGYMIRVYLTCPLDVVQGFHKAAGVTVEIPREEITYRSESDPDPFALDRRLLGEKP